MSNKLSTYTKTIVSFLTFAFAAIALFFGNQIFGFHINADFQQQVIALIPLAAGVVAVFGTKNATPDAIDKAIMQFVLGAISVSQFFTHIPSDLGVKIGALVYAGVTAYFVYAARNSDPTPIVTETTPVVK
jgi:hypothetical protein